MNHSSISRFLLEIRAFGSQSVKLHGYNSFILSLVTWCVNGVQLVILECSNIVLFTTVVLGFIGCIYIRTDDPLKKTNHDRFGVWSNVSSEEEINFNYLTPNEF